MFLRSAISTRVGVGHLKADASEAEAVRILAEVGGVGRRGAGAGRGEDHLAIVLGDGFHLEFVERVAVGVGEAVPAPVAEDADGHRLLVVVGEGLEAGDVEVEGELAVADGHDTVGVGGVGDDVVAGD